MAKICITRKELLLTFPTLGRLMDLCGSENGDTWGIVQSGPKVKLGPGGGEWVLMASVFALMERATAWLSDYDPEDVIVFYGTYWGTDELHVDLFFLKKDESYQESPTFRDPSLLSMNN